MHAIDALSKKQLPYVERLNRRVQQAIEGRLAYNRLFTYRKYVASQAKFKIKGNPTAVEISKFVDKCHLFGALSIRTYYTRKDGFAKRLAKLTKWTIWDRQGKARIKVDTWVFGDEKIALLPNTRNPKHEQEYIKLAGQNAKTFLRLLGESATSQANKQ